MNEETLWATFDTGNALSNDEINFLIDNAKTALKYLESRRDYVMAARCTRIDLRLLESYKASREANNSIYVRQSNGEVIKQTNKESK